MRYSTDDPRFVQKRVTIQEINDYLEGYNRLYSSWVRNRASSDAKAKGLANYQRWFHQRNIELQFNGKTKKWEIEKMLNLRKIETACV